ncbi:hypothetical protein GOP47_0004440 [Adiantum capillus-veneris]|uniref:RING-type domain-containing protein n=1 Tax=Adiantum capillus-veneris TaxID=13818 RepID=A0A9D4V838_ADICA|nr:hypothetical protein GOP47_0003683 [Adiantum capillus-veneris]KAI5081257.1 hypothetical protein GOP47_0004440 [Adiantum capillus-veneris]
MASGTPQRLERDAYRQWHSSALDKGARKRTHTPSATPNVDALNTVSKKSCPPPADTSHPPASALHLQAIDHFATLSESVVALIEHHDPLVSSPANIKLLQTCAKPLMDRLDNAYLNAVVQELQSRIDALEVERATLVRQMEEVKQQSSDEVQKLRKELEEEKQKSICCICMDKARDTVLIPCMHSQFCLSCIIKHQKANGSACPTCRAKLEGFSWLRP